MIKEEHYKSGMKGQAFYFFAYLEKQRFHSSPSQNISQFMSFPPILKKEKR